MSSRCGNKRNVPHDRRALLELGGTLGVEEFDIVRFVNLLSFMAGETNLYNLELTGFSFASTDLRSIWGSFERLYFHLTCICPIGSIRG